MPRLGSVWLDCVCLVPNETSCWMVAWMRLRVDLLQQGQQGRVGRPQVGQTRSAIGCGTGRGGLRGQGHGGGGDGGGGQEQAAAWTF